MHVKLTVNVIFHICDVSSFYIEFIHLADAFIQNDLLMRTIETIMNYNKS